MSIESYVDTLLIRCLLCLNYVVCQMVCSVDEICLLELELGNYAATHEI